MRRIFFALNVVAAAVLVVVFALDAAARGELRLQRFTYVAIYFIALLGSTSSWATAGRSHSATTPSSASARTRPPCS
jgi:lipopolysaccharide export LptBFGC system permease protein LptF